MQKREDRERHQPGEIWLVPPHVVPDRFQNKILFAFRLFFDLQFVTVFCDTKKIFKEAKNNILEIGCGPQIYKRMIPAGANYVAIDYRGSDKFSYGSLKDVLYYDGKHFPALLKDGSFELIFYTEVLEHVWNLDLFLSECHRVASNNCKMFFTVPFAARYHYIPYDYWRLTPACIEKLLKSHGFGNIVIKNRGTDLTVAVLKLNAIFYRIILKKYDNRILGIFNTLFFGALFVIPVIFFTVIGHLSILLNFGSPQDTLGYSVYAEKVPGSVPPQ